jgi:hypothetical protein
MSRDSRPNEFQVLLDHPVQANPGSWLVLHLLEKPLLMIAKLLKYSAVVQAERSVDNRFNRL